MRIFILLLWIVNILELSNNFLFFSWCSAFFRQAILWICHKIGLYNFEAWLHYGTFKLIYWFNIFGFSMKLNSCWFFHLRFIARGIQSSIFTSIWYAYLRLILRKLLGLGNTMLTILFNNSYWVNKIEIKQGSMY